MDGMYLYDGLWVCSDLCCTMTPVMMSQESIRTLPGRESLSQWLQTSLMLRTLPSIELTFLSSLTEGGVSLPLRAFTAVRFLVFPHCSSFGSLTLGRRVCYYPEPWQTLPACSRPPYRQSLSESGPGKSAVIVPSTA